jgi:hypothetical protein
MITPKTRSFHILARFLEVGVFSCLTVSYVDDDKLGSYE